MSEQVRCARCHGVVDHVITLTIGNHGSTPPLCTKCFKGACEMAPRIASAKQRAERDVLGAVEAGVQRSLFGKGD